MTDRTRLTRALGTGLLGIAAVTTGAALLTGCSRAPGSASFTITYTPDDGGNPITETVTMDTTDCEAPALTFRFGEDVGLESQAEFLHRVEDDPRAVTGFLPGVISGETSLDHAYSELVVTLPDGAQYYSIEPFETTRHGFTLTDHPGKIVDGSIWVDTEVVATTATATGTFTC